MSILFKMSNHTRAGSTGEEAIDQTSKIIVIVLQLILESDVVGSQSGFSWFDYWKNDAF